MTQIWRINLKPGGLQSQDFCIQRNVLGVGWPVETDGLTKIDWQTYEKLGDQKYRQTGDRGWSSAMGIMKDRMQKDDLCWTRNTRGEYYLGRITSDWRYEDAPDFQNADVVNVRDCEWMKVGTLDAVPGKIIRSFIPRRTVQRVADMNVEIFSMFTYNKLIGSEYYKIGVTGELDIYSFLSPDDCEDLVGCYLQIREGYMIVPSTCKHDTKDHEYVLKDRMTGEPAIAQVKTGSVNLSTEEYGKHDKKVYLFTSDGEYTGACPDHVVCMKKNDLLNFMNKYEALLPEKVRVWVRIMRELRE